MTKTLNELLEQKEWTGRDVGLIHLYSVENDITSALKGVNPKRLYSQAFFDKITGKLSDEEAEKYHAYGTISSLIFETVKLRQTYLKEFNSCYYKLFLTFQEVERAERALKVLDRDERSKIKDILFTSDALIADKTKMEDLEDSAHWLERALSFIYVSNFVQAIIFKTFDIEFMNTVLFDTKSLDGKTDELNSIFNKVVEEAGESKKTKLRRAAKKIETVELLPREEDLTEFREKINLENSENSFYDTLYSVSSTILEIVDKIMKRRG